MYWLTRLRPVDILVGPIKLALKLTVFILTLAREWGEFGGSQWKNKENTQ